MQGAGLTATREERLRTIIMIYQTYFSAIFVPWRTRSVSRQCYRVSSVDWSYVGGIPPASGLSI